MPKMKLKIRVSLIVITIVIVGVRIVWVNTMRTGNGCYMKSPDEQYVASVNIFNKENFYGKQTYWSEFVVTEKDKEVWKKRLYHNWIYIHWYDYGKIQWINNDEIVFSYRDTFDQVSDRFLEYDFSGINLNKFELHLNLKTILK